MERVVPRNWLHSAFLTARRIWRERQAAAVDAEVERNPLYRTARNTVFEVAGDYGVAPVAVVFREGDDSLYRRMGDVHLVIFGVKAMEIVADEFEEYPELDHLVPRPRPTAEQGARCLALHEAAHMLVAARNLPDHDDHHGEAFQIVYSELLGRYL